MSIDTDKIKKPKEKKFMKLDPGEKLYDSEGNKITNLQETLGSLKDGETYYYDEDTGKFSIRKIGKTEKKSGPDLTKRAKGGMINKYAKGGEVKKYMGGGSVHKNKSKMITKRGWGASRKT